MWDKPLLGSDIYKYVNIHTVYIYLYKMQCIYTRFVPLLLTRDNIWHHINVSLTDTRDSLRNFPLLKWRPTHTHTHTLYLPTHSCNSVSCLSSPELMLSAPMIHVRLRKHWDLIFFFKYTNDKRQEFYLIGEEKMIHMETHLWNHWVIQVLLLL